MKPGQKHLIVISVLSLIILSYLSPAFGDSGHVGIIKVSPGEKPENCYDIIRKGKAEKEKGSYDRSMPVFIGDKVQPKNNKKVRIVYVQAADYGEKEITQPTIIGLPDKAEQELKSRLESVKVFTTKSGDEDTPCFPAPQFNLSPFPVNGTTLLAGEPVFFRWFENGVPCSEAVLVISEDKEKPRQIEIRLGRLEEIAASVFSPGKSYQWHIEQNSKAISETYRFRVLSRDESDSIRRQLDNVAEMYKNRSPLLFQAFYLQFISNDTQDFYADSLRLIKKYMDETPKPDILIERLHEHHGK